MKQGAVEKWWILNFWKSNFLRFDTEVVTFHFIEENISPQVLNEMDIDGD